MTIPQLTVLLVLAAAMTLFIVNRWRYDIVAMAALLLLAVLGIIPPDRVFAGFGHPAVITVAAVLVISQGLINAGMVDSMARLFARTGNRPLVQMTLLTVIVTVCSVFMNNVGALALMMPLAIWVSRRSGKPPSALLMPLAFGSILGGTMSLIGTPPNIIIASFRQQTGAEPFAMFDFLPSGLGISVAGLLFMMLFGRRLIPLRKGADSPENLFSISDYISEIRVPEDSKFAGNTLHNLMQAISDDADVNVIGIIREDKRQMAPQAFHVLHENDILLIESDHESLKTMLDRTGFELEESKTDQLSKLETDDVQIVEAMVSPGSRMIGRTPVGLNIRARYGVNVLAVARHGRRLRSRIGNMRFVIADILLLQGGADSLNEAMKSLGCLPLAERGVRVGRPRQVLLALSLFSVALVLIIKGWLPAHVALALAALAMVVTKLIAPGDIYKSIDWPVIVLLGAMIPVGESLESTGGAGLIATLLLSVSGSFAPWVMLTMLMIVTMALTNVVNNAAAAILMAPIAIGMAQGMDYNVDPFLMAVAVSASSAFLTPIGHQSNALVLAPGGYKFSDYSRLGLPLSVIVIAVAVPLILRVWPLSP